MSPGLFQDFMDGYLRLSTMAVKYSVVVMTLGSQSRPSQTEDSDTGCPSSVTVGWNTNLFFNSDIVNFV